MHRLYWKIFLAFWLSLVFFLGTTLFAASFYLETTRSRAADINPHQRHMILIHEAQMVANQGGVDGLKHWLAQLDRSEIAPYYLLDRSGNDLLGRNVPADLAFRFTRDSQHMRQMNHMSMLPPMAIMVRGSSYLLVPDFQGANLWRVLARPRVFALPLVVTALLSGLLCYWLARYLLKPVQHLRDATQDFAAGNFDHRVAPELGNRRDEIAELAGDFDQMAERVEQLMSSQMTLLADVSHELRSPLARMMVALELAEKKRSGETSVEFERIGLEVDRMNHLVAQILSITRMESGTGQVLMESIDLNELLENLVANCNFEIKTERKRVILQNNQSAEITGDPELIASAIENVIRNAARHTEQGEAVDISLTRNQNTAIITIRDHGPGLPPDMLDRVFNPFVRVGESRDRNTGGYGLGLSIAKRAIKLHKGKITARNEPDAGLQVIIDLPLARSEQ